MGKLSDEFETFLKASQVGMQKTEIVVQPAISHPRLGFFGSGPLKVSQYRPECLTQVHGVDPEKSSGECGPGSHTSLRPGRPQPCPKLLGQAPSFLGRLWHTLGVGAQHLDMGVWRHCFVNPNSNCLLWLRSAQANDNWRPASRTFPYTVRPGWPARRDFPLPRCGHFPELRCGLPCARLKSGAK